jgi:hypothetical protein
MSQSEDRINSDNGLNVWNGASDPQPKAAASG